MAELWFVGTGEALDAERPNTSLLYRGSRTLLLDCGPSVPQSLWRLIGTKGVDDLDAVWVSHLHADHCFGLPTLMLWMRLGGRTAPLPLLGGPAQPAHLRQLIETGYPGSFEPDKSFAIDPVMLSPGAPHELGGGVTLTLARSDHSVPSWALRLDDGGRSVAFSGDGAPTDESLALYAGCELVVHECWFATGAGDSGHADLETLLPALDTAGVGTVALVHVGIDQRAEIERRLADWSGRMRVTLPEAGERLVVG